jgi:flagellar motility protein MotE (MotC chaperone)
MSQAKPAETIRIRSGTGYADISDIAKGSGRSNIKPAAGNVKPGNKGRQVKKKRGKVGLIVLILIILIIGIGAGVLYFTGYLDTILVSLGIKQTETIESMSPEELAAWESKLITRELSQKTKEEELAALEEALKKKEQELYVKEKNLQIFDGKKKQEYTQTFQDMISSLDEEEVAYFKKMSLVYAKMDPVISASVMLELYDIQKTAAIIYYMLPEKSARILENMEAETAAQITEIILT